MDLSKVSKKNPHSDSRMTLSAIDEITIEKFNRYYNLLPEKKHLLNQLIKKKNAFKKTYTNEYHDLLLNINELETEIRNIENKTQMKDYLIKAVPHFFDYNSNDNDNQNIKKEIFSGFYIKKNESMNKGKICDEYIKECVGDGYSLSTKSKEELHKDLTCESCKVEKLTNPRESYASCPLCGDVTKYQDTQNNKGEYSEEVEVLSPFAYKRINHFREWLSTFEPISATIIGEDILTQLRYEMKKNCIEEKEQVTEEIIKVWLKKLKLPKLYEHAPTIRYKLCGIEPPKLSKKLKDKLIEMFQKIQIPFEKYAPTYRRNFLSYAYTLHKLCQLLKQDHLLGRLSLLKSREKLYQQDIIWKGICNDLGWAFIPSL
jgi:hypothetical protein